MAEKAFEPVGMMGPQIFGLPVDRETLFSNVSVRPSSRHNDG